MIDTPVDKSALVSATMPSIFSSTRATLLGLAGFIDDYHVVCLVMRYVTVLAFTLLSLMSKSMRTCVIILAVVLTMQPPGTPIEKFALTCESPSGSAASTLVLGDFIWFSEAMRVEHRMAMEKLIEKSNAAIQSLIIHTILILVTLIGGMVFYVRDQYPIWIKKSNSEVKNFVLNRLTFGMLRKKRPKATPWVYLFDMYQLEK